jgi:hypothetical protein
MIDSDTILEFGRLTQPQKLALELRFALPQESGVLPDITSIFRDLESNSLGFNHHIGKKTSDNLVWVLNYDES